MPRLTQKEIQKIQRLRGLFPREISVHIARSQDGGFVADATSFPGCVTEADTFSELIDMINDAVRTMFEIPKKYVSFMPEYLAPLDMAQRFNIFPFRKFDNKLKLIICGPSAC
jgi:predicted RNase H-like HicB family nuclease